VGVKESDTIIIPMWFSWELIWTHVMLLITLFIDEKIAETYFNVTFCHMALFISAHSHVLFTEQGKKQKQNVFFFLGSFPLSFW